MKVSFLVSSSRVSPRKMRKHHVTERFGFSAAHNLRMAYNLRAAHNSRAALNLLHAQSAEYAPPFNQKTPLYAFWWLIAVICIHCLCW